MTTALIEAVRSGSKDRWSELDAILEDLPKTDCQRLTDCCALLPQMSWTEAGRLLHCLEETPGEQRSRIILRVIEYYFLNAARIMGCPFLENSGCLFYAQRPFGCRAYGLWSPSVYRRQADTAVQEKKKVEQAWASMGITIPKAVLHHRPPYCRHVKTSDGGGIGDEALKDIGRRIQALDQTTERQAAEFARDYFNDLSFLLAADYLGRNAVIREKVTVVREFLMENRSPSLEYLLEKAASKFR